jgi:hypothetical protein
MKIPQQSTNRLDLWTQIINQVSAKYIAEIGVWKGDFAASMLGKCPTIEKYYMVDPWAQLPDWNKPFNVSNKEFKAVYDEALQKTGFASEKRLILKGKTKDVIGQIVDSSLDFVYIDGDHTLRGITVDLINILPKVRNGGLIGGDDFTMATPCEVRTYPCLSICSLLCRGYGSAHLCATSPTIPYREICNRISFS